MICAIIREIYPQVMPLTALVSCDATGSHRPSPLPATDWLLLGLWLDGSIIVTLRLSLPTPGVAPQYQSPEKYSPYFSDSAGLRGADVTRTAGKVEDTPLFSCHGFILPIKIIREEAIIC